MKRVLALIGRDIRQPPYPQGQAPNLGNYRGHFPTGERWQPPIRPLVCGRNDTIYANASAGQTNALPVLCRPIVLKAFEPQDAKTGGCVTQLVGILAPLLQMKAIAKWRAGEIIWVVTPEDNM